jgi:hypothetical protein
MDTARHWHLSHRADPRALPIADRHYNRQKVGSPQFVPPGRCVVLLTETANAFWVSSWPFAQYVRHAWAGAWVCSAFRREDGAPRASELIREAIAATRCFWEPPSITCPYCARVISMVSFVDPEHVRTKPKWAWGRCYQKAGWQLCSGQTKGGLYALHLDVALVPEPVTPIGYREQLALELTA